MKKKQHNGRRSSPRAEKPEPDEDPGLKKASPEREAMEFDAGIVEHVRVVTGLIEGRPVSRAEVLEMLRRVVRQHSLVGEMRIDYVLRWLKEELEKPP